ncbi:uncharacterized protein N7496_005288 [Penicillium cataractarum]|uniref:RecF/RecN/SMC N-terminal domain-containing protein n=1 Tax=Penicillium cataractarum TaxID=2100454 RepID=A0A9W9SHP8_9EURO|nr:uncharacterized protein N7496_005288 [Penicillium cataractarum]KAJ5377879.1 hypothetical protein N7496_005288 [Penicillium cataractarum]
MPSLKRVQVPSDSDDGSDGGSESAASNSTPYSRKRARLSDSSDASDGSEANERHTDSPSPSPSASADDGFLDEDADEEELELRQTQLIQDKYAHLIDEANVPAEHGVLERVECYNFMCHTQFSVELGPLINFIIGKNGSGKSAVLTAITLCLGGKASATNRGQSLKSFIKEGKENASIIVRIKNQGEGAYLPDDYGKSIIVERHFTKSGSSGFKIKNAQGRIVSTKKAELDAITDYFSLQIDNPMNVLSQDMARQFLSTSSPAEKYKFFIKGVQLEQLDQDYRLIEESVDQIEEKLRIQEPNLRFLENQRNVAKRKLELSDKQDFVRERIRNLRKQLAWSHVEDLERERDLISDELAKADEGIANAEAQLGEFDDRLQGADVEMETAIEHCNRADGALEECQKEKEQSAEKVTKVSTNIHESQADQRNIKGHLDGARSRLEVAQEKVKEEELRLIEVSNGSYARKQEEADNAQNRAATARTNYESREEGQPPLREAIKTAEMKATEAQKLLEIKQQDLGQAQNRLRELTRENAQVRNGFHEKMPALLRAIQQERSKFATPPVGPIGHHVTLLKPKWASIIESTLGSSLESFVVKSHGDQKILSAIMKRVGCQCPILVGSNENIDTTNHEPDSQYLTVLRALQIDSDLVRSHLIVRHSIERMLLVENLEEASSLMFDGQKLRNVVRCYSLDSRDHRRGVHLAYNREGAPSQSPVQPYKGDPRMKSDLASQTSHQREVVQLLERQRHTLKQEHDAAVAHVTSCKQDWTAYQRQTAELKIEMQQLEDHAESLKDALETNEDGQLDALKTTLRTAEVEVETHEASFEDAKIAHAALMENLKNARRELKEKVEKLTAQQRNCDVVRKEKEGVEKKRRQIISEKNVAIDRIDANKTHRNNIRGEYDQKVTKTLVETEKASLVSERIRLDEGETTSSLEAKMVKLKKDEELYNAELGGSREQIANDAAAAENTYQVAKAQVEESTTLVEVTPPIPMPRIGSNSMQILKNTLHNRKKRWEIFRSHISSRAKAQFTYLLSERGFRGRLLANHQEKLLDLQVEPDITKDDSTGRGAKTLSGGEKSFSQICLLLALWEAMGSPIRCLDEFDVFMDHINRKLSIDMLMIAARRSIGRQFILITPGTKTDITLAPDVRVKELAEPERGQTTLAFQR